METHWLVTKANEINELAGPGRGVTVIKVTGDDRVIAFLCTSERKAEIALETAPKPLPEEEPAKAAEPAATTATTPAVVPPATDVLTH